MQKTLFFLMLIFIVIGWAQASNAGDVVQIEGGVSFWKAPLCLTAGNCILPQPFSAVLPAHFNFIKPTGIGSVPIVRQSFSFGNWTADLLMVWIQTAESQAYIATQWTLKEASHGTIALCSRYDGADEIHFLPVGSCAGQLDGQMFGVSALSPNATLPLQ